MPPKTKRKPPPPPIERRLDLLEAELAQLRAQLAELGVPSEELAEMRDDVDELRAAVELRAGAKARGAEPNPYPVTPADRKRRARDAAKARAAKDVGKGSGHVSTKAVQKKLQADAAGVEAKPGRRRRKKGASR